MSQPGRCLRVLAAAGLSGVALDGFDPVSYFLGNGPKPGLPEHELVWGGVAWRFASAANREAFRRDPDAYAPRFGGYDAEAGGAGLPGGPHSGVFVGGAGGLFPLPHH